MRLFISGRQGGKSTKIIDWMIEQLKEGNHPFTICATIDEAHWLADRLASRLLVNDLDSWSTRLVYPEPIQKYLQTHEPGNLGRHLFNTYFTTLDGLYRRTRGYTKRVYAIDNLELVLGSIIGGGLDLVTVTPDSVGYGILDRAQVMTMEELERRPKDLTSPEPP